ncbi:hypothetical protein, partial [Clavibacter michiganensis]
MARIRTRRPGRARRTPLGLEPRVQKERTQPPGRQHVPLGRLDDAPLPALRSLRRAGLDGEGNARARPADPEPDPLQRPGQREPPVTRHERADGRPRQPRLRSDPTGDRLHGAARRAVRGIDQELGAPAPRTRPPQLPLHVELGARHGDDAPGRERVIERDEAVG